MNRARPTRFVWSSIVVILCGAGPLSAQPVPAPRKTLLGSRDLQRLRSVTDAQVSPDGSRVAYAVQGPEGPGNPRTHLWIMDTGTGKTWHVGRDEDPGSGPVWSPDGSRVAYTGTAAQGSGLLVVGRDGGAPEWLAPLTGTNSPLPSVGNRITWSPDGNQVAYLSATPGPETAQATGDPIVISRYMYKPAAAEGLTRFNDNRRMHIFVVDVRTKQARQLTEGRFHEHSIDWSPDGTEILFISNREADPDRFFNNDVFAIAVAGGVTRQLTRTENAEYRPTWSPDGRSVAYQATRRGLTCNETTMEDTHVWLMNADGTNRRDIGASIDNRQGGPAWSPDGSAVYFTVTARGNVSLHRLPVSGGQAQVVVGERGTIGAWSVARGDVIAYAFHTPRDLPQLHLARGGSARALTNLNADVLGPAAIADVEAFTFMGSDGQFEVEAFLTKPIDLVPTARYPLIVSIHGGPHGQSSPTFNLKSQVYAARGFATLMVNFRGSIGYGQRFVDAIFGDQGGREAQDVLFGLSAAMRRYPWIDADRLGVEGTSYGGQLTNWLITQTTVFKAAVPIASVSNLISVAYTSYVKQYMHMEFGAMPHQGEMTDLLWERSPLKHVGRVRTPTLLLHGEGDNDVPITEAEQFYSALQDVGVEAVMVRYPREGHGLRETAHVVDSIDRSLDWYQKHFAAPGVMSTPAGR